MLGNRQVIEDYEKASGLFFDDGDIVLSSRRPGSDTLFLFKLHRKVLTAHAKTFSDMLVASAAPKGGADVHMHFEGTPVVALPDDPTDLVQLFKAMYVPSTLIFRGPMAVNASDVFPLLVLADKYMASDIKCLIECQIRRDWPKNVHEWDAFENRVTHMYRMHQQRGDDGPWDALVPEPASYICCARIARVIEPRRIGAAFYQLSRMNVQNGWAKGSGRKLRDPTPTQLAKTRGAMWSLLSKDEMRRLERGKERLASHMARFVRTLPEHVGLHVHCVPAWNRFAARLVSGDILAELLRLCHPSATTLVQRMCCACLSKISRKAREEREEVWVNLPYYFEVYPKAHVYLDVLRTADDEFVLMQ